MFDRRGRGQGQGRSARTERACEWRRAKQRRGRKQAAAFITVGIERKHIMIQETPQADLFKQQMRESLRLETIRAPSRLRNTITFTRVETVMRWSTSSRAGRSNCSCSRPKERVPAGHPRRGRYFRRVVPVGLRRAAGNSDRHGRDELKTNPLSKFFARLGSDALFAGFVQYLAVRIADQQQAIANLVTVDSEQRLGKTLLQLARKLGKKDPRSIRIELKISHEELSEMVGTTRPRISMFMQRFRNLGLIETNENHFLVIKEKKLTDYLAHIACAATHVCGPRENSFKRVQYWTETHLQSVYRCKRKPESGKASAPLDPEFASKNVNLRGMLWTIIAVLVVLWLLGLIGGVGGSMIHALLVIAAIVLIYNLVSGRRIVN